MLEESLVVALVADLGFAFSTTVSSPLVVPRLTPWVSVGALKLDFPARRNPNTPTATDNPAMMAKAITRPYVNCFERGLVELFIGTIYADAAVVGNRLLRIERLANTTRTRRLGHERRWQGGLKTRVRNLRDKEESPWSALIPKRTPSGSIHRRTIWGGYPEDISALLALAAYSPGGRAEDDGRGSDRTSSVGKQFCLSDTGRGLADTRGRGRSWGR